jgi:hypothetical protein
MSAFQLSSSCASRRLRAWKDAICGSSPAVVMLSSDSTRISEKSAPILPPPIRPLTFENFETSEEVVADDRQHRRGCVEITQSQCPIYFLNKTTVQNLCLRWAGLPAETIPLSASGRWVGKHSHHHPMATSPLPRCRGHYAPVLPPRAPSCPAPRRALLVPPPPPVRLRPRALRAAEPTAGSLSPPHAPPGFCCGFSRHWQ